MKRVPILPTAVVALAVVAMIALGLWQGLVRLPEKEAYLAQLAANPAKPPIAFPATPDDRLLFRRSEVQCLDTASDLPRLLGAGAAGFRVIAQCPTAAGGLPVPIQLGTTRDPNARTSFRGGRVSGYISHAPDTRPLIAGLWDHSPRALMLIGDTPPAGLGRNTPPDLSAVPNNHLAYAGQWFFFAAVASIIYVLALRRRRATPG